MNKPLQTVVTVVVSFLMVIALASGQAPTSRPAAAPAGPPQLSPQEQLALQIQAVRLAPDVMVAAAAYARGANIDPNNADLNRAYLTKALETGYPELAYLPAVVLTRQNAPDGQAWAVLGTMLTKSGQYVEGLDDIVKAVETAKGDPYVQARAGELLAWYDRMPKMPGISMELQEGLEKARGQIQDTPAYQRAYEDAKAILSGTLPPRAVARPATCPADKIVQLTTEVQRLRRSLAQANAAAVTPRQVYGPTYNAAAQNAQPLAPPVPNLYNYPAPGQAYPGNYNVPRYNPYQGSLYPFGFFPYDYGFSRTNPFLPLFITNPGGLGGSLGAGGLGRERE